MILRLSTEDCKEFFDRQFFLMELSTRLARSLRADWRDCPTPCRQLSEGGDSSTSRLSAIRDDSC